MHTQQSDPATAAAKQALRRRIRAERVALGEDRRARARTGLTEQLTALVAELGAESLSCYLPTATEPDTRGCIEWATARGITVMLPSSLPDHTLEWIVPDGTGEVVGAFGIAEPRGERLGPLAVGTVDVMLIPAAAADTSGNRLGWGRGYFDRNLALLRESALQHASPLPPVFAIVFDHELLSSVPHEAHDIPLDGVVTPERVVRVTR